MGSAEAGNKSAVIYSILGSCRRAGINAREYLVDVFQRLPSMKTGRRMSISCFGGRIQSGHSFPATKSPAMLSDKPISRPNDEHDAGNFEKANQPTPPLYSPEELWQRISAGKDLSVSRYDLHCLLTIFAFHASKALISRI